MTALPPNIQEFNIIAGLIFAQLYKSFPVRVDINRGAIAEVMGAGSNWSQPLASGRPFTEVLAHTISWLVVEGYITASGSHPAEAVALATKGLTAMNAIPEGLQQSVGAKLADAADEGSKSGLGSIGDLIGGIIGGTIKSVSSG